MSRVVEEHVTSAGDLIFVEVDEAPEVEHLLAPGEQDVTRGPEALSLRPFERGMALVRSCANSVACTMREIAVAAQPAELEVEFAIKFASEVGAFLAKTGTDAQLKVTLKWVRKEQGQ